MRPVLIALFGSIIALPSAAILTCGAFALALWVLDVLFGVPFLSTFLAAFWYATGAAVIAVIPVFRLILKSERELHAVGV